MLHIGFAEFADPTLLFAGKHKDLLWLAHKIGSREATDFGEHAETLLHNVAVKILDQDQNSSLAFRNGIVEISLSSYQSHEYMEKIVNLVKYNKPGHVYIDPDINELGYQIVISLSEYDTQNVFSDPPHGQRWRMISGM
ncbi:hypothetical protein Q8W71_03910 [Methylobacterium sp. NEAU 140]|uniref:hypothetical protein n=1 Tax=Methylobacterium sp. NEAU 140 TaxID=3064945 RepID=UPI002732C07A|nr:hypothetical protein [Methylobacterium sp. NEAU 140]MDP4021761.1 hypothetical protein [Methylobacterium sp. NEAU 140]